MSLNARAQGSGDDRRDVEEQTKENNRLTNETGGRLHLYRDKLTAKITRRKQADLMRLDRETKETAADLQPNSSRRCCNSSRTTPARKRKIEDDRKAEIARQAPKWKQILRRGRRLRGRDEQAAARDLSAVGSNFSLEQALPTEFRPEVFTGDVKVNLKLLVPEATAAGEFSIPETKTLLLPLVLTFPLEGSLCIRAGINRRDQAIQMLFNSVCALVVVPRPGKPSSPSSTRSAWGKASRR